MAHWKEGGHKEQCKALQASAAEVGGVPNGGLAESLAALSTSLLKNLLAELGETAHGCIEKVDLVRRAVDAIERSTGKRSTAEGATTSTPQASTTRSGNASAKNHAKSDFHPRTSASGTSLIESDGSDEEFFDAVDGDATPLAKGSVSARAVNVHDDDGEVSVMSLESHPPPIRSGRGYPGDARLTNVGCDTSAAKRVPKSNVNHPAASSWQEWQDYTETSRRKLGPMHVKTLNANAHLAQLLSQEGMFDRSLSLFREILPIMKRVMGPNHKATLHTCAQYALALMASGQWIEAEAVLVTTLPAMKRVCGPKNKKTIALIDMLDYIRNPARRK